MRPARPPKPLFGVLTSSAISVFMFLFDTFLLLLMISFYVWYILGIGPGSSVGIATGYGLAGPGIESQWGEIFHTRPDWPWGPPSFLYNG
jgi:hypothetical protein